MKIASIKCPDCGATLDVDEDREQVFCSYCGAKIMLQNENEHIERKIDQAAIEQEKTNRLIVQHQIEMEKQEAARQDEHRQRNIIIWAGITGVLLLVGIIGYSAGAEATGICLLLAIIIGIIGAKKFFGKKKESDALSRKRLVTSDEVIITQEMCNCSEQNYNSVIALFRAAGFLNISVVPLNDLSFFKKSQNGTVKEVSINGIVSFEEGEIFPNNSLVVITYHSTK